MDRVGSGRRAAQRDARGLDGLGLTSMPERAPRLSIVVASRNDAHGGNLQARMRIFVRGLLDQTRRHGLDSELIVVEWNPPADRPPLHEVLPAPSPGDLLTIRYIVVPKEIHRRYRCASSLPLFQMIAKNVGIRRASGAFILCTNVDLLFSDALCRELAATPLGADTYYRANRCDVPDTLDPLWPIETQLAWCGAHVIRRVGRDPRYANINLELLGLQDKNDFKKWLFDKMALRLTYAWPREKLRYYQLDTFACGDFTLMSHDAWSAIRGYLELDMYSLHVDSLALIAAAALGYEQVVFPREACTYHISHRDGWAEDMSPVEKIRFFERRPSLDYNLLREVGLDRLRQQQGFALNDDTWGYADTTLEERVFSPDELSEAAGARVAAVR
jgi:hypothetical protein